MKNRDEDAYKKPKRCTITEVFFITKIVMEENKKSCIFIKKMQDQMSLINYFFIYITSFTSFTVRETSGNAKATRLGA
jgi:hypothetical protein